MSPSARKSRSELRRSRGRCTWEPAHEPCGHQRAEDISNRLAAPLAQLHRRAPKCPYLVKDFPARREVMPPSPRRKVVGLNQLPALAGCRPGVYRYSPRLIAQRPPPERGPVPGLPGICSGSRVCRRRHQSRPLDLADGYGRAHRQAEKKRSLLRGPRSSTCFFESSTRHPPSFEVAGKRLRRRCHQHVGAGEFDWSGRDPDRHAMT